MTGRDSSNLGGGVCEPVDAQGNGLPSPESSDRGDGEGRRAAGRLDAAAIFDKQEPVERVGYARPPQSTRFQAGRSGNPRGRPKGARNLSTLVAAALGEHVAVNENGKRRRISKMEAVVKQLVNRAASGEARATQLLIALVQSQEASMRAAMAQADTEGIDEADAFVMAEITRRMGGSSAT